MIVLLLGGLVSSVLGLVLGIGRMRRGLPELVILGLDPSSTAFILNTINEQWDSLLPTIDEVCSIPRTHTRYSFLALPDSFWEGTDFLLGAEHYRQREGIDGRSAYQVVWTDDFGCFPWEPDFTQQLRKLQPILGLTVVPASR